MLTTRFGMKVTLCHPPGKELCPEILKVCEQNSDTSGGAFIATHDLDFARRNQDIIYARHWGAPSVEPNVASWYCDDSLLGNAWYVHPMPVDRGIEASPEVVNGQKSLTRSLIRSKHFVQKSVLALLAGR